MVFFFKNAALREMLLSCYERVLWTMFNRMVILEADIGEMKVQSVQKLVPILIYGYDYLSFCRFN